MIKILDITLVDVSPHASLIKNTRKKQHHLQYARTILVQQTVSMQPRVQTGLFGMQTTQDINN